MPDFTVSQHGTDSSGRPIFATAYMWAWWLGVVDRLGFTPVVVQGAFMTRVAGGGADASAGYHDAAGCLDLRVWDLDDTQQGRLVRELRRSGAAGWIRDAQHGGMDPHLHLVLGTDQPLADGAAWQWQQYLDGRDGLSSGGRDYHWRPDPLITEPPGDDMASYAEQLNRIEGKLDKAAERDTARTARDREVAKRRNAAISAELDELAANVDDVATRQQLVAARDRILAAVDEPDV